MISDNFLFDKDKIHEQHSVACFLIISLFSKPI